MTDDQADGAPMLRTLRGWLATMTIWDCVNLVLAGAVASVTGIRLKAGILQTLLAAGGSTVMYLTLQFLEYRWPRCVVPFRIIGLLGLAVLFVASWLDWQSRHP